LVYYYDGLCDQNFIRQMLQESYHRLEDFEKLGHQFVREPNGKLKGISRTGLRFLKCYLARPYGNGGSNMIGVLVNEAKRLGVKSLGKVCITDLIKKDDTVVGAVGFNILNGDYYIFHANVTILTAGDNSIALALRAGAKLKNCEFGVVRPNPKLFMWEGQTSLFPLGAKLVNAKNEPFMERYSPKYGSNTDWHYNAVGMAIETRANRGPTYLDCGAMNAENAELMKPVTGWQILNYRRLIKLGVLKDFFHDKTEWITVYQGTFAGLVADLEGRTGIPGLLVAGTAHAVEPGVYMGGWNLCKTAVTGYIAGETAGKYAGSQTKLPIDGTQFETYKSRLFASLGKAGISPRDAIRKVRETVSPPEVCLLKSDSRLEKALTGLEYLKNEILPQVTAQDTHYLMKFTELQDLLLTSELFLRASIMRTETRAGHYREDYPERDSNWLKWIIVSQYNGKINLSTESVPVEKYQFKPTRYYMDNFKFSGSKE
jgi:succinate dehydrogenase / fumarate reductase, flavoprotein subunit